MNSSLFDKDQKIKSNFDNNQLTTLGNNEKYRNIKETLVQQKRYVSEIIQKNKSLNENIDKILREAKSIRDELKESNYETNNTSNETNKNKLSSSRFNSLLSIEKEINNEVKVFKDLHKSHLNKKGENFEIKDKCIIN